MLTLSQTDLELVSKQSLKSICASDGPFISVFLPARHPGAAELPRTDRLKDLLRTAAGELKSRQYLGPIARLLDPLEEIARNPSVISGGDDSVIFVSPAAVSHFRVRTPVQQRLVVASHPHIIPLLQDLALNAEYFVLALSKKHLRLGRGRNGDCAEVALPASIPSSLHSFGGFDQPDHDLENRSASGPGNGQMREVHFGTSADREQAHLHDYFRLVDRELAPILRGTPLVLAGVGYEIAAYRRAAGYSRILETPPASPEHAGWPELAMRAKAAIAAEQAAEANLTLEQFRETRRRDHVTSGVYNVLEAARQGRVQKLLLVHGAEYRDLLGPLYPMTPDRLEGVQDLLNAAAVETIRVGGEVYELSPIQMGSATPVAAILRYSPVSG